MSPFFRFLRIYRAQTIFVEIVEKNPCSEKIASLSITPFANEENGRDDEK